MEGLRDEEACPEYKDGRFKATSQAVWLPHCQSAGSSASLSQRRRGGPVEPLVTFALVMHFTV